MDASQKDPIIYNRTFLLGFESKPAAPPSNLNEILGPLHLVKGSAFPPFQRTKKEKTDKTEKQRTKAPATKPLAAALPKKAEAKPEAVPEKPQPAKAETKRVPFSSIPKTAAKNTQIVNTPAKTAPVQSAKAQLTTLNKENLVNVHPSSLLAVAPAKAFLETPKDAPKASSLAGLPPLDVSKLLVPDSEEHRLAQRQKQIDYGYKTIGYQKYITEVPKSAREAANPNHPVTPRKGQKCSKRSWDGQVRKWRRGLHQWDSKDEEEISHWMSIITEKFGSVEPEPENEQEEEPFQATEEYSSFSTPAQQFTQPSLVF